MNKFILLISILLLTGCASQDPWTKGDTILEVIYVGTVIADGLMTSKIQDHPNIVEVGPIARHALGQNPSTTGTWLYMGTAALSHYLVAKILPRGWRTFWQIGGIYTHGSAVIDGQQLGIFSEPCTVHACE
ncbi:hypothetical protein LCGC14_0481470 [marine sediment metagenome]|uniref:Uncharacterized protein n=1 Tax=marine sediment metagenome TaxID=412755 RepID=A0A0F9SSC2_9ZZZZ